MIYPAYFMPVPDAARLRHHWPHSSLDWLTCAHQWRRFFGPCLRCARCGAQTIISMDARESKPIFPPSAGD